MPQRPKPQKSSLGQQILPKSSELRRIQRLSEEIGDLMIRRTILELNVFVNDFLLQETQANFIMLSVPDVLNTRIRLSNRRTVIFSYFQRPIVRVQLKILQHSLDMNGVLHCNYRSMNLSLAR